MEEETLWVDTSLQYPLSPPSNSTDEVSDSQVPPIFLLFQNILDSSSMKDSDTEDSNAYGYFVLAVPKTIPVPYKLCSGKTITMTKPFANAKQIVSRLYYQNSRLDLPAGSN
ncbi:hypothetical protein DSO57_1032366 [Entomophthora muscae]|uniref:Uncharacterized protein n=1 Tax=Entomophthora muscae TaxID=34485 RepID=A0ACC2UL78_9FUNG|nr:hypothetical protein DSO57_1032366 [Entomophthora muscae]